MGSSSILSDVTAIDLFVDPALADDTRAWNGNLEMTFDTGFDTMIAINIASLIGRRTHIAGPALFGAISSTRASGR